MTSEELYSLTIRLLDQLEWAYAESEEDGVVLVATDYGPPIIIGTDEISDSDDILWPVLWLDVAVRVGVEAEGISAAVLGQANQDMLISKVALETESGRLAVQHECVGWPGAAELRVAMEMIMTHASELSGQLGDDVGGEAPATFSELVE